MSGNAPRLEQELADLGLIGQSPAMTTLGGRLRKFAVSMSPLLITGERGTGKELVARACHKLSGRTGRFVAVNCGEIVESLFASEMFGHVKGAFTGAVTDKDGRFSNADGGTLFLDEVGTLSPENQTKLLRAVQEGEILRVGEPDGKEVRVDVRIVAATNEDLAQAIADGRFRRDLYDRVAYLTITTPPLRDRRDDIMPIAERFLGQAAAQDGKQVSEFAEAVRDLLLQHVWPGNVRELRTVVFRAVALAPSEAVTVSAECIEFDCTTSSASGLLPAEPLPSGPQGLVDIVANLTVDGLIGGKAPLEGLRRSDHQFSDLAQLTADGIAEGLRRFLALQSGVEMLRSFSRSYILERLGLRPRAGNRSKLFQEITKRCRDVIDQAYLALDANDSPK